PAVIYIAKLGVPGLLLETGTTDRMTLFAKQILGTVQQDDMAKSGDLMSTLLTWFSCDMSSRETAQQMFVHPNTIGYRLRRIGELTGLRMTDPGDLMTVRLALDVLQIQGRCVSPGA
ncbi:MAG TPA: helix-turn-helix domain-containing protein, partial [Mycobacterium sp.]